MEKTKELIKNKEKNRLEDHKFIIILAHYLEILNGFYND